MDCQWFGADMSAIQQVLLGISSAGGGGGNTVTVAGSSTLAYVTATSQNVTVPSASVGDLLLAIAMHRAVLTPPAGWTLVDTISNTLSGTLQYLSFYSKTAVSGDLGASTTWGQASSARMGVQIVSLNGTSATPAVLTTTKGQDLVTSPPAPPMFVVTGTASGQIGIAALTSALSTTSTVSASAPFTLLSPASNIDNRVYTAYRSLSLGQQTNGTFGVGGSSWPFEGISALIG